MSALAARAARLGSKDPEAAAQEAVRRSLAHAASRPALEYYFQETAPAETGVPDWSLLQLLGWLHGVLRFVVWEERARASAQRETTAADDLSEFPDPAPSQLDQTIDNQLNAMVRECLSTLSEDYRSTLLLRMGGAKYAEIAARLGVNEKTVATWVRRGSLELVQQVRQRLHPPGRRGVPSEEHHA
ncbi:MAG TPA: RNA polymerase sigma factor [Vicinamibacterales bacterium]|jgi:RNA polymerase sigma factor (sigma-70 family)|nr:RNA polymerase sigma factor [Vicinamibacterales bacterium]